MTDILLIHGSCHGAWAWDALLPYLDQRGLSARAIDLPAHGDDPTPIAEATLAGYAEAIAASLSSNTLLVGHSMAGYPITAAAELAPDKIAGLVYLAAYVPQAGLSLAQMRRLSPEQPLIEAIRVAPDRLSWYFDPVLGPDKLMGDLCKAEATRIMARLGNEPLAPQETPLEPRAAPELPRFYIRCLQDHAVPLSAQVAMSSDWPSERVFALNSSHAPFLSQPKALADTLLQIYQSL